MISESALLAMQYAVAGGLMAGGRDSGEAIVSLTPENFPSAPVRALFEAIAALYAACAPIDAVTVIAKLGDEYTPVVSKAIDSACEPPKLRYYCEQLQEQSRLREMQLLGLALASAETAEQAQQLVDALNAQTMQNGRTETVTWQDASTDFLYRMASTEKPDYISLGLAALDAKLYLTRGKLVVLGGFTSAGKTLLSLQFAASVAKKLRVGYFTLETDWKSLTDRMMAHLAQQPLGKIKSRSLTAEEQEAMTQTAERNFELHLTWEKIRGITVADIRATALAKHYDAVFVDYLQLLNGPGGSDYERTTRISKDLHALAQEYGILVVALSQLSRVQTGRDGKAQPPTLSSFRESGQIEQDADVALLLYPAEPGQNGCQNRVLSLAKNKDGELDQFLLDFHGATQTFRVCPETFAAGMARLNRARKEEKEAQLTLKTLPAPDPELPF